MAIFPTILIDTREQKPFTFKGYKSLKRKLHYGDYSLRGFTKRICIERKSFNDFFSTLSSRKNFKRFERELVKLSLVKHSFLVVEAFPEQIIFGCKYTAANGYRMLDKIFEVSFNFKVQVIFGGNRIGAEFCALSILKGFFNSQ